MTQGSTGRASWVYRIAWTFYLVLAVGGLVWVGLQQGRIDLEVFVRADSWWIDLALGLAAGGTLILVWMVARQYLASARRLEGELAEMLGPLTTSEVIALALLSGFAEEMFFRGAMQGAWGWLPATIVFALLHAGPGPSFRIWTIFAAVAGLVLAGLMLWRGNLLAPVVAHVVINGINLGRLSRLSENLERGPDPAD